MTDHGLLFSKPMVLALLAGRKTQTRRTLKPQPDLPVSSHGCRAERRGDRRWVLTGWHAFLEFQYTSPEFGVRFDTGDRLWVREHWRTGSRADDDRPPSAMDADRPVVYAADADGSTDETVGRLRQAMHMPRWASRLTLTVTDVRVERLQDITAEDAADEGLTHIEDGPGAGFWMVDGTDIRAEDPVEAYMRLWEEINGTDTWWANPWVVATTFTVARRNIDR